MAITTAEQLLQAGDIGRCELIRGELRMMIPPSARHGRVTSNIGTLIHSHVSAHELGTTYAAETGFLLARNPDTVMAPDVGFVAAGRPREPDRGYYPGPPDLAVEVLSPDDRPAEKVARWLEAGTHAVWVVDPVARTVTVHEQKVEPRALGEPDVLRGGKVLPGFAVAVREIFV